MALVTDRTAPPGVPTTNALADLDVSDDIPPAYLSFGSTPCSYDEPPEVGEKRTYIVRVECTGQSETMRTDGEHRYGRKLSILWAVREGKPKPPDPDAQQPSLFGDDDEDSRDDGEDPDADDADYGRPPFSGAEQ